MSTEFKAMEVIQKEPDSMGLLHHRELDMEMAAHPPACTPVR